MLTDYEYDHYIINIPLYLRWIESVAPNAPLPTTFVRYDVVLEVTAVLLRGPR